MKKYVKPELFYERYELSQHIADCHIRMNAGNGYVCTGYADPENANDYSAILTPNEVIFTADVENCSTTFEQYCYMNAAGAISTFNS